MTREEAKLEAITLILLLRNQGYTDAHIARQMNISERAIQNLIRESR
jgi:DNA-binding NarL/FixJ family response regulator